MARATGEGMPEQEAVLPPKPSQLWGLCHLGLGRWLYKHSLDHPPMLAVFTNKRDADQMVGLLRDHKGAEWTAVRLAPAAT